MVEKIEKFLSDLMVALLLAKIYPPKHPKVEKAIDDVYNKITELLSERDKVTIAIIGDELAFEKEIFFDLSKNVKQAVKYLKEKNIDTVTFYRGALRQEMGIFIDFLIQKAQAQKEPPDPVEYLNSRGIRNIAVGKIGVSVALPTGAELKMATYLAKYEDYLKDITQMMESTLQEDVVDFLSLRFSVVNVLENLIGAQQEFLKLTNLKRLDVSTFVHILNVSILSMYLSYKMGFKRDDVLDIGIAGLYHDIGKMYIARKIIAKPGKLTDEEFLKIKSHPVLGAELLLKYADSMGTMAVVVAFEHHIKYDLNGYPKLIFAQKPHPASLIVSICDVYDALCQRRTYKRDYPPNMVYDIMYKEKGTSFEPEALDKFFSIMGVWPIGTIVLLSDQRVAVVRQINEDDVFSPKVEVISEKDKRDTIDLSQTKDSLKIDHSLNPLAEGKQYLSLV